MMIQFTTRVFSPIWQWLPTHECLMDTFSPRTTPSLETTLSDPTLYTQSIGCHAHTSLSPLDTNVLYFVSSSWFLNSELCHTMRDQSVDIKVSRDCVSTYTGHTLHKVGVACLLRTSVARASRWHSISLTFYFIQVRACYSCHGYNNNLVMNSRYNQPIPYPLQWRWKVGVTDTELDEAITPLLLTTNFYTNIYH